MMKTTKLTMTKRKRKRKKKEEKMEEEEETILKTTNQHTERRVLEGTAFVRGQNFSDTQGKRTRGVLALKGLSVEVDTGQVSGNHWLPFCFFITAFQVVIIPIVGCINPMEGGRGRELTIGQ